jgi:ABC-type branched-subunit amino acid transport system substrate-binding protein
MMRWCLALLVLIVAACGLSQPEGPRAQPTSLRRADAAYARGEYSEAVLLYRAYLDAAPEGDADVQASYRMAASYYRLGRYDDAARILEDLRQQNPEAQWPAYFALYGDVEEARGRNVSALIWWERAYTAGSDRDRGQLSARINALVEGMSDQERQQARPLSSTDFVWRLLNSSRRPRSTRPAVAPDDLATPTATPGPESARIGLLLPLSGRMRAIGEASLEGARVAVRRDQDLAAADSRGSREGALAAYRALADDASVVAVVGPLRIDETAAVAGRASATGVPLLPLSQSEDARGAFAVQTAMTRSLQAQTLAAYAVRRLGLRRFAVVHPRDAYGAHFSEVFRLAAQSEGATLVGTIAYSPGQAEFATEIEDLRRLDQRSRVEAVFLPDSAANVALLAPELRRELPHLQLLGPSEWNEAGVLAGVARSMEGAIFVDGFHVDSVRPATRAFVDRFRGRYGRGPGLLEAQAHDAAALVEAAVRRGAFTRQEISQSLENFGLFEGAGGDIEIREGVVRRQLFLLRFRGGELEELSW